MRETRRPDCPSAITARPPCWIRACQEKLRLSSLLNSTIIVLAHTPSPKLDRDADVSPTQMSVRTSAQQGAKETEDSSFLKPLYRTTKPTLVPAFCWLIFSLALSLFMGYHSLFGGNTVRKIDLQQPSAPLPVCLPDASAPLKGRAPKFCPETGGFRVRETSPLCGSICRTRFERRRSVPL